MGKRRKGFTYQDIGESILISGCCISGAFHFSNSGKLPTINTLLNFEMIVIFFA